MSDNARIIGTRTFQLKNGHKMTLNYKFCKRCGICVAFCPKKVYDLNPVGQPVPIKPEECTICMQCVLRCPDYVIEIEKESEDSNNEYENTSNVENTDDSSAKSENKEDK